MLTVVVTGPCGRCGGDASAHVPIEIRGRVVRTKFRCGRCAARRARRMTPRVSMPWLVVTLGIAAGVHGFARLVLRALGAE